MELLKHLQRHHLTETPAWNSPVSVFQILQTRGLARLITAKLPHTQFERKLCEGQPATKSTLAVLRIAAQLLRGRLFPVLASGWTLAAAAFGPALAFAFPLGVGFAPWLGSAFTFLGLLPDAAASLSTFGVKGLVQRNGQNLSSCLARFSSPMHSVVLSTKTQDEVMN